jgi:ligand-binding SRPBCC domain-containing protein
VRDSGDDIILERVTIRAPLERCFALSTRVELVQRTLGMKLIGGVTTGHITANSRVIWRGWKFGLPTEHHTLITAFEAPHDGVAYFEDSQEQGRFASFRHEHLFRQRGEETELEDRVHFALPFGPFGRLAAKLLLAPHIRKLARQRFAMIKELAEGDGWREWLEHPPA